MVAWALFEPIRSFLSAESLSHFTESHHAAINALQSDANLGTAIKLLHEHKILSVPVLDADGEYYGCLSVGDILRTFMGELEIYLSHGWAERIPNISKDDLEAVGRNVANKKVSAVTHPGDLWLKGDAKTTILTIIKEGFQVLENKVHHRIFVVDPAKAHTMTVLDQTVVINIKPGTEKPEASGLRPTDVVSQFDVVKLLTEHRDKLELVEGKTLEELEVFEGSVFTVSAGVTALEAFHHMATDHKSCLGVVDAAGKLIGNVSISDIRALTATEYGLLLSPVAEFIAVINGKGPSAADVINGTRAAGAADSDWATVLKDVPVVTVTPSSTFGQLLDTLVGKLLHRVYVVDDEGKPLSIVTLTDVLREIIKPEPPAHNFKRIPSEQVMPEEDSSDDSSSSDDDEAEKK